jgi:hypothetical protein
VVGPPTVAFAELGIKVEIIIKIKTEKIFLICLFIYLEYICVCIMWQRKTTSSPLNEVADLTERTINVHFLFVSSNEC